MIKNFAVAFRGIGIAVREQMNMKIHLLAVLIVSLAGLYFRISDVEWTIVILCFMVVITAEIINTAIEEIVNFISPEYNIIAGKIKDLAAGAVLCAAIGAIFVAFIIFKKYLFAI